jgi:hypothetical protein
MTWDETGALVITDCNTLRRYEGSDLIVRILGLLSQPRTTAALVEALRSVPALLVTRTLDFLRRSQLVVEATASGPTLGRWTLFELAMQRQLSLGGVRAMPNGPRPPSAKEMPSEELIELVAGNAGGALNRPPCVVFLVTAVFARTMWRYAYLGLATIYRDVGCLFQTMYLVATEMGLAPCAIGGVQDVENARWLRHDALEEAQVGSFLLGVRE